MDKSKRPQVRMSLTIICQANSFGTEAFILDLSVTNGMVSPQIMINSSILISK